MRLPSGEMATSALFPELPSVIASPMLIDHRRILGAEPEVDVSGCGENAAFDPAEFVGISCSRTY